MRCAILSQFYSILYENNLDKLEVSTSEPSKSLIQRVKENQEKLKEKIMKINWINSWKAGNKQDDKFCIKFRVGTLTLLEISSDFSQKYLRLIILNVGVELGK